MAAGKTNRPLLGRICAPDTLRAAWERVRSTRARGGIDGQSVDAFAADADRLLDTLRLELIEGDYVPLPAHEIRVPKDNKPDERRTLGLAAVRDKVAQEAVRRVLEPRLDRLFRDCSYGYRPGRGPQRAIKRVAHHLAADECSWVVSADIDDFFGSVDHDLLLGNLRAHVQDEAVLRLLALWLKMGTVDGNGRWRDVYSGVLQGHVVSPLLANFYLNPFDQSLTDQGLALVRYADDFVICCRERRDAERALQRATAFLGERLKLRLNANPRPVVSLDDGFVFLGVFFTRATRTIAAAKCESAAARLKALVAHARDAREALRGLNEKTVGWRRYYAAVVPDAELARLEAPLLEVVAGLLRSERTAGRLRCLQDGAALIEHLELLRQYDAAGRRRVLDNVVHKAFANTGVPEKPTGSGPPQRPRRAGATRRRDCGNAPQPNQVSGIVHRTAAAGKAPRSGGAATHAATFMRARSVDAIVRQRKREHLRRAASVSELVLTTPGMFLGKTGGRLVVRQQRRTVCEVPLERLTSVTIATAGISLSSDAVSACAGRHVPVLVLSTTGDTVAMLSAPHWTGGAIGLAQLRALADSRQAFALAAQFVGGKIRAQRAMVKYLGKYHCDGDAEFTAAYANALDGIGHRLEELRNLTPGSDPSAWRGQLFSIEGRAAGVYWDIVRRVLAPRVAFAGRERHGATDLVNVLLNYGYAVLQARVYLAIVRAGLNPQISFLHALQPEKPTLAFDLMEIFRPPVVDRTVIALLTRRRAVAVDEQGRLTDGSRSLLLEALHERLAGLVRLRRRECTWQEIIDEQARAVARHVQGARSYRPFVWKW